jgi:hypothetical protein
VARSTSSGVKTAAASCQKGLGRRPFVGRRLAHEIQAARGARARRVEEVAIAADRVGSLEACSERAAHVVVEERRAPSATRKRALLEPEHEHRVEATSPCPHQVEDGDAARRARHTGTNLEAAKSVDDVPPVELVRVERGQLVEEVGRSAVAREVEACVVAYRRRVEPVSGACHGGEETADALEVRLCVAEISQRNERCLA